MNFIVLALITDIKWYKERWNRRERQNTNRIETQSSNPSISPLSRLPLINAERRCAAVPDNQSNPFPVLMEKRPPTSGKNKIPNQEALIQCLCECKQNKERKEFLSRSKWKASKSSTSSTLRVRGIRYRIQTPKAMVVMYNISPQAPGDTEIINELTEARLPWSCQCAERWITMTE